MGKIIANLMLGANENSFLIIGGIHGYMVWKKEIYFEMDIIFGTYIKWISKIYGVS